jgi:8-oxo-dGTP pyrophosphatase MutT (NUDIX family)
VVRETREEIGLDLRQAARPLGGLADVMAKAHGKPLPLIVRPFVFALPESSALDAAAAPFAPNSEVQEVMWVSLAFLQDRRNRGTLIWRIAGVPLELPCYRFGDGEQVLWGLTLKMVDELLALVER